MENKSCKYKIIDKIILFIRNSVIRYITENLTKNKYIFIGSLLAAKQTN